MLKLSKKIILFHRFQRHNPSFVSSQGLLGPTFKSSSVKHWGNSHTAGWQKGSYLSPPPAVYLNIAAWRVQGGAGLGDRRTEGRSRDKARGAEGGTQVTETSKQHWMRDGNCWFEGCCHDKPGYFQSAFQVFQSTRHFSWDRFQPQSSLKSLQSEICVIRCFEPKNGNVLIVSSQFCFFFLHESIKQQLIYCKSW